MPEYLGRDFEISGAERRVRLRRRCAVCSVKTDQTLLCILATPLIALTQAWTHQSNLALFEHVCQKVRSSMAMLCARSYAA